MPELTKAVYGDWNLRDDDGKLREVNDLETK